MQDTVLDGLWQCAFYTLPAGLSELKPALYPAPFQPLFAFQLPKLLLGSAFGVASLPLVVVIALLLKAFLVCFF